MLVHHFLEVSAQRTPDAVALVEPRRQVTFGQLERLSSQFASLLQSKGVGRGDRVIIALDNSVEFAAAYFGVMKAGGVAVPLPAGPRSDRLARAAADCTPKVSIIDPTVASEAASTGALGDVPCVFVWRPGLERATSYPSCWHGLAEALQGASLEFTPVRTIDLDLAAIIYTSGSTGEPRGVMLRHRNIVANTRSIISYLNLTERDRVMCVLPFHYVYGLSLLHTHIAVGGSVVIDNRFAFPNVVLDAMREHRVTGFAGVPSTFALLLHRSSVEDMTFPSMRYVTQAGGNMPAVRVLEWLERGPQVPLYVMYGATEAAARLTYVPPAQLRAKLGSIGRAIPNVEILVVKDDGERAAPGEVGELVARGSNVACGYWNDPEETQKKFGPLGYHTGDLGYADEDGFLYLTARRHDMMKVGAHRVGAKEIEDVLHEHPAVYEVAVVPVQHDLLGEVPVAFVALRRELTDAPAVLHAFCAGRLAPYKVPARITVSAELPKLPGVGKIDKVALRELATSHSRVPAAH